MSPKSAALSNGVRSWASEHVSYGVSAAVGLLVREIVISGTGTVEDSFKLRGQNKQSKFRS